MCLFRNKDAVDCARYVYDVQSRNRHRKSVPKNGGANEARFLEYVSSALKLINLSTYQRNDLMLGAGLPVLCFYIIMTVPCQNLDRQNLDHQN